MMTPTPRLARSRTAPRPSASPAAPLSVTLLLPVTALTDSAKPVVSTPRYRARADRPQDKKGWVRASMYRPVMRAISISLPAPDIALAQEFAGMCCAMRWIGSARRS